MSRCLLTGLLSPRVMTMLGHSLTLTTPGVLSFSLTKLPVFNLSSLISRSLTTLTRKGRYSEEELQEMEHIFSLDPNPSSQVRRDLASKINRTEAAIGKWFSDRRRKFGLSTKRDRQNFSTEDIEILESVFSEEKYPNEQTRKELAKKLKRSEMSIYFWFQNKRWQLGMTSTKVSVVKRSKTKLTEYEKAHLERLFLTTQYPDIYQRRDLAKKISVEEKTVLYWFRNRRLKLLSP